ncbi:MAG: phenylalanine--tRNA ligase subunit beta [Fidelibacterota bacterium]
MIVNRNWLEKYTELPYSNEVLEERLTYLGLEAVMIKNPVTGLDKLIVGEVKSVEEHPDADKLSVCEVYDGSETKTIVCGAPNVAPGQKVPVALPGCELPGGFKIKQAKIRGVKSAGMIAAEDELGLSEDHTGIMVLNENAQIGITMENYLNSVSGANFEIDLTPNRPDCTSHIGVARDLTTLTGKPLNIPETPITETNDLTKDNITVEIQAPEACPRYAARVIKNIKIGPSPKWLANYLKSVGLRPINNIVDLSNFVLMETGQPLHTFDYDKVANQKIVVRKAKKDETVVTLDGEERKLNEDILLICDAEKPVAVAGIMGLGNSEISETTTNILIESAYFEPATIRKGSKKLALQTDASYRFERGADPENAIYALNRISSLIQEIAGGDVTKDVVDNYPNNITFPKVKVRFERINSVIGFEFKQNYVVEKFQQLGCEILDQTNETVTVQTPSWRPDLEREIDYIEEIVRIYGMENIPAAKTLQIITNDEPNREHIFIEKLRDDFAAFGYNENYNNTLVSEAMANFELFKRQPIRLQNPLSNELAYLRTALLPGLINTAKLNFNRNNFDLKLFEIGKVQEFDKDSETTATETLSFAALISGKVEEINWSYDQRDANIYYLKGLVEELAEEYNLDELRFVKIDHGIFSRLVQVFVGKDYLCYFGQLHPLYLNKVHGIEKDIWVLEGNGENLFKYYHPEIKYEELPKFPATERDISIVVDDTIEIEKIEAIIRNKAGKNLKEFIFYDQYQGENIDQGKRSLTFNLVFQNKERTLKDKEIDKAMTRVHGALKKEINAELR